MAVQAGLQVRSNVWYRSETSTGWTTIKGAAAMGRWEAVRTDAAALAAVWHFDRAAGRQTCVTHSSTGALRCQLSGTGFPCLYWQCLRQCDRLSLPRVVATKAPFLSHCITQLLNPKP